MKQGRSWLRNRVVWQKNGVLQFKFRPVSAFLVLSVAHREIPYHFLTLCSAWLSPGKMWAAWVTVGSLSPSWTNPAVPYSLSAGKERLPGTACGKGESTFLMIEGRNWGKTETSSRWSMNLLVASIKVQVMQSVAGREVWWSAGGRDHQSQAHVQFAVWSAHVWWNFGWQVPCCVCAIQWAGICVWC